MIKRRMTYEDLVELCDRDGIFIAPKGVRTSSDRKDVDHLKDQFGITQAQWNAIPDRGTK